MSVFFKPNGTSGSLIHFNLAIFNIGDMYLEHDEV